MSIIVAQEMNPEVNISKLSEKSSQKIVASCSECSTTWTTSKRSISTGATQCPTCRDRAKSLWWGNSDIEKVIYSALVFPESPPLNPSSGEKVKVRCPQCDVVQKKQWSYFLKKVISGESWCHICFPEKGLRTGELLVENHPEHVSRCKDNIPDFTAFATSEKFTFHYDCGHDYAIQPNKITNFHQCPDCIEDGYTRLNNSFDKEYLASTGKRRYRVQCDQCSKDMRVTQRTYKKGEFLCRQCSMKNSDYFTGETFDEYIQYLTKANISWSEKNSLQPEQVSTGSAYRVHLVCSKGHNWASHAYSIRKQSPSCPLCQGSSGEQELFDYIRSILPPEVEIQRNNRTVASPYEADIYIPSLKIAIEYNGLFWHSEARQKEHYYHYNKLQAFHDAGVQLIMVWEDDFLYKTSIVKDMLRHKMGISDKNRIYARKTCVATIDSAKAKEFCEAHHIQGYGRGGTCIGLFHQNELVAVSVWSKNKDIVYLSRYCTSHHVIGGMSKLVKAGIAWAQEHQATEIVTFADLTVSDGNSYETLGFTLEKTLQPDYKYLVNGKRVHKFNYRKKRFYSDPELRYVKGATEKELAKMNNIHRIWDCGKKKYVMKLSSD